MKRDAYKMDGCTNEGEYGMIIPDLGSLATTTKSVSAITYLYNILFHPYDDHIISNNSPQGGSMIRIFFLWFCIIS